jgi:hypothetical protein
VLPFTSDPVLDVLRLQRQSGQRRSSGRCRFGAGVVHSADPFDRDLGNFVSGVALFRLPPGSSLRSTRLPAYSRLCHGGALVFRHGVVRHKLHRAHSEAPAPSVWLCVRAGHLPGMVFLLVALSCNAHSPAMSNHCSPSACSRSDPAKTNTLIISALVSGCSVFLLGGAGGLGHKRSCLVDARHHRVVSP